MSLKKAIKAIPKSKVKKAKNQLENLFEDSFNKACQFVKKETFTPEDKKRFAYIKKKYAESFFNADYFAESYENDLEMFVLAEAREGYEGLYDVVIRFLAKAAPIAGRILLKMAGLPI